MHRQALSLLAVLLAAAALVSGSAADTPSQFSTTVFFRIVYRADCTFTVSIDGGIQMDSATGTTATIPPGPYQVSVRTPLPDDQWDRTHCTEARLSFNGPGVSYSSVLGTDLPPYSATLSLTFQPSSTYTIADGSRPTLPIVFTTADSGTSTQLLPKPTPTSTSTAGSAQTDLVGSGIVPYRGAVDATVPASGPPTLAVKGKPLVSLKAGRYDLVVDDRSARGGLYVQKGARTPRELTGAKYEGRRTVRMTLTPGMWSYYATRARAAHFAVTS